MLLISFIFHSCGNDKPYKPFSLKNLSTSNDSIKHFNDSILTYRASINADYKEKKLEELFKQKSRWNRFNGAVLIAQDGHVIFKNAYGYANYKEKIELTTKTAFQLASTSKTFTATAIMMLKEQGKLDYNDDIKKYIPEFPYDGISIKMLLTHRTGLPNFNYFAYSYIEKYGNKLTNDTLLKMMLVEKPLKYSRPNRRFSYSNTNYALLATLVEIVSGISFPEFMDKHIFKPLNLENTWINTPENAAKCKNKTTAYSGRFRVEEEDFLDGVYGDKGTYSSVEDLFKWDQSFYKNTLLSKETLEEAFTGQNKEKHKSNNYGYGFRTIEKKDVKAVYHNGWWHCYNTTFYRGISDKFTIIILSNKYNKDVYQIDEILKILSYTPKNKPS